jgi:hypothetical protein
MMPDDKMLNGVRIGPLNFNQGTNACKKKLFASKEVSRF